uniref:Uncharacterized protein n=1 Tax=Entomoneis paludosa TaxID=265537 RepID=A0A7S2Y4G9_9STRA
MATLMRLGWGGPTTTTQGLSLAAVLLPADLVVGNTNYNRADAHGRVDGYWFTWQDLYREMPKPLNFITADIPGKVLFELIRISRQKQPKLPPKQRERHEKMNQLPPRISFLHTCTNVEYSQSDPTRIERIDGEPFDRKREYLIAFPLELLDRETLSYQPLLDWAKKHPTSILQKEAAQRSDYLIAQAIASTVWFQPGSFLDMRVHGGILAREQIRRIIQNHLSRRINVLLQEEDVIHVVVDHVLSLFDTHDDSYGEDGGADGDVITTLDIMAADPIVMDAILLRQRESQYERQDKAVLEDCASDFVGVDDHSKHVSELVDQFRSEIMEGSAEDIGLDDDDSSFGAKYARSKPLYGTKLADASRLYNDTLDQQHEQDDQDDISDLHAPLVRRLTLKRNLV